MATVAAARRCGIYEIRSRRTGKLYIGSSVHCHIRKLEHFDALEAGKHHSHLLQAEYDYFLPPKEARLLLSPKRLEVFRRKAASNLVFKVIKSCSPDELEALERQYIARVYARGRSLNVVRPGHPRWQQNLRGEGKGKRLTPHQQRLQQRQAKKGVKPAKQQSKKGVKPVEKKQQKRKKLPRPIARLLRFVGIILTVIGVVYFGLQNAWGQVAIVILFGTIVFGGIE